MAGFQKPRRRAKPGPSKNEQKVNQERAREKLEEMSGKLGERYPHVAGLEISWQMKTPDGAVLAQDVRKVTPQDVVLFDVNCEGSCGKGSFLLTDAVHDFLARGVDRHQGRGVCRAASYSNASVPCGVELSYQLKTL
jgi:hypothetical protein